MFQQKDRYKTTWQHPRSKHWHLLDYILTRQRDINDVQHTRVMPNADCYTDHRLDRSKVAFTFKLPPWKKDPQTRRLNIQKLRCQLHQKTYQAKLAERLDRVADPDTDIDQHWTQLKTVLQETTAEVAGFSSRKHKDWFDESNTEIQELLEMKCSSHQRLLTNLDKHQYINTSIHQYINTSIHQYINTSIHQYINTSIHQYINTSIHQYINTSIHQYINTSIHQYINTSIHQCINTSIRQYVNTSINH